MFISMSFGAMVKHIAVASVGGFVAGVSAALLYQKVKGGSFTTAVIATQKKKELPEK